MLLMSEHGGGRRFGVGCGVLGGICFIVTAHLLAGDVSWGVRWLINAIGWLTIAAVIIPWCEQVRRRKK